MRRKMVGFVLFLSLIMRRANSKNVTCSENESICEMNSVKYGCCSYVGGVCCADRIHCCPTEYICNTKLFHCVPSLSLFSISTHPMQPVTRNTHPTKVQPVIRNNRDAAFQHLTNILDILNEKTEIKNDKVSDATIFDIMASTTDDNNSSITVDVDVNIENSDFFLDANSSVYNSFTAPGAWVKAQGLEPILVGGVGSGMVAVFLIAYLVVRLRAYKINKGYQHLGDHAWTILEPGT